MQAILLEANNNELFVVVILYIIAGAVSLWIFYEIISSATKSRRNIELQNMQVKLLANIALKLGVDKDQILKDTKSVYIEAISALQTKEYQPPPVETDPKNVLKN